MATSRLLVLSAMPIVTLHQSRPFNTPFLSAAPARGSSPPLGQDFCHSPYRGVLFSLSSPVASSAHRRPISSSYFHIKKRKFFVRSLSASAETLNEEQALVTNSVTGDAIRQRFLNFFAARGHKILPSSSLVPDDPTVLLTIAGMLQFKPVFLGQIPRQVPRAATSQKCIRTNDIENVGRTARHQTFFEMLGNFSFGDYFKRDAIKWAWELVTEEYKLPADRLWITVFEDDDEAFTIWRDEVGIAEEKIKRMGERDNFWSSGSSGPCGPCSEIYYDFKPEKGTSIVDLGDDTRFIEFYNLVFMQFNRNDDGSLVPLQNKNIDTGLGLERLAQILQKVPNNYETDLIFPIMKRATDLAGREYTRLDENDKTLAKVIGDHARAVVYLISDGVSPSNIGRGYVVRRLIRRAVRMGKLLGIRGDGCGDPEGPFMPKVAEVVVNMSSHVDPEVKLNASRIYEELRREELKFVQTLERGERLLEQLLSVSLESKDGHQKSKPCLSGKDVFTLYDTYGFPVEITQEVASEHGVFVDIEGFEREMEFQRKKSQAAHNIVKLKVGGTISELSSEVGMTEFCGYNKLALPSKIVALISNESLVIEACEGDEVEIVLDRTPFYAESGGQIGDNGLLVLHDGNTGNSNNCSVRVQDVQKVGSGLFIHKSVVEKGRLQVGAVVDAVVDAHLRRRAQAHHTATHLLQSSLKKTIGKDTCQAGSLVAFDKLRFDFNFPRPLTDEEITKVERLVNEWITMAVPLQSRVMAITDAKNAGAIAMFGEKYGEQVRVVEVPGISLELCGGTHVSNTIEIQGFKVVSEQGIASGIRRIEAVAGPAFLDYVTLRDAVLKELSCFLKVKADDLPTRVSNLLDEAKSTRSELSELRAKVAIAKADALAKEVVAVGPANVRVLAGVIDGVDADSLKIAAEYLLDKLGDPAAILVGSCPAEHKVSLIAAFSPRVVQYGLQAGKFVHNIASICGGGGGGRSNFGQAGGKKPEKLTEALQKAWADLNSALSNCS